jgi:hypothetical protein
LDRHPQFSEICTKPRKFSKVFFIDFDVALEDGAHLLFELGTLISVMKSLNCLLKRDCDQKTHNDCGDVDEEVAPSVDQLVGGVHIEHGR